MAGCRQVYTQHGVLDVRFLIVSRTTPAGSGSLTAPCVYFTLTLVLIEVVVLKELLWWCTIGWFPDMMVPVG